MYKFNSQVHLGPKVRQFTQDEVKNEPMLFSADFDFAVAHGGPLTWRFIQALNYEFREAPDLIIDSRVHMLMPGFFPCIPGFHHDDVPRTRVDKQPNYDTPEYHSKHAVMLVNGDICPTEFALGECELDYVDGIVYKKWHQDVVQLLEDGKIERSSCPSNQVVYFNYETFHQGTKAVAGGWRFFIRASINTDRKPVNEIRRQVQVYLEYPMEGW